MNSLAHFRTTAILIILAALGFGTAFYRGPAAYWVNNSLGGVFYEIFWCFFFSLLFPAARPLPLAASVLAATSALEFMQLWHPPVLESVRAHFPGRALIGNSFDWWDFPHYAAGCALGVFFIRRLR